MITVLLIDDEESLLHLCKTYLERASDIRVETVLSAREGEDKLLEKAYDAIVTEYHLPWRSGLELLKRLRMRKDQTPLIFFTNKGNEDVAIDALNSGADFYLQKGGNPKAKFEALEFMVREAVHRRRWQKALALKHQAFDESPNAHLIIDTKGNILEMNPSFKVLWGFVDQNEVVLGSLNDVVLCGSILDIMATSVDLFGRWQGDLTAKRKDGSTFTTNILSIGLHDDTGKLTGYLMLFREGCTSPREFQAEQEAEIIRIIAQNSGDWIALLDEDDRILFSTPSVQDMSGHAPGELIGHNFIELVHPDDVALLTVNIGSGLVEDKIPLLEFRFKHRDGRYINLETKAIVFKQNEGRPSQIVMVNRDVSSRKPQAVEVGAAKQVHLTKSDDLKKLLTIQEFIEREKEKLTDVQSIERFDQMGVMTAELIENLNFALELQSIGKGKPLWQSIQKVIHNVVENTDVGLLHVQVLAMRLEVEADPMLKRAFHHLIENTIKHGGNAHKIWVLYEMEPDGIKIIYEDNGLGIPDELKPRLFEDTGGGRHGLYLVKQILATTGITILENGKRGKGVRFEMLVPKDRYRLR